MAAAAVGPCFSASTNARAMSKHAPRMISCARIPFSRALVTDPSACNSRALKMSVAVAQEEAAVEVEDEGLVVEAEAEAEAAVETEEGLVVEAETEAATEKEVKLYFGNLPYNCDSSQLAGIIQEYGSPEMVEVLYDRQTGRSRGFAFVTMSSTEDAESVIQNLDGTAIGGRTLRVNFSDKPRPKDPLYPETEFKLFVGNLSWSVTSESLTEAFKGFGHIVGARVLYDGETGRSRGYGFVCYSSKPEMEAALASLDGVEIEGRAIRVSVALGKKS
ncbi:hypothetical protein QJS04_geneDACA002291 [Acorus gramineus]|uniref:RRM domain-containing protein n=1 Tax=Acorus gramineus TaxID=55184 RepID=A0AAV9A9N3_ACOGR|nr:hypothetical protein QJS04_geneDACA002291 [Acorus gramineus]